MGRLRSEVRHTIVNSSLSHPQHRPLISKGEYLFNSEWLYCSSYIENWMLLSWIYVGWELVLRTCQDSHDSVPTDAFVQWRSMDFGYALNTELACWSFRREHHHQAIFLNRWITPCWLSGYLYPNKLGPVHHMSCSHSLYLQYWLSLRDLGFFLSTKLLDL